MTVSTTIIKNSHNGNGSTTTFAYSFKIFADSDLVVIIRSSTGTETTKTLTTHYTVTGAGSASGGTVVFTSGNIPASGETVVIRRNVPQTQVIDYIANDPFPAETHEEGLDRNTMIAQQVSEATDRSIKLSRTNTMTSTEFTVGATDRANKVLSFDSSGELAVTQELGTFRGNWSASTAYQVRDLVKDTSTNNIFMANTAHTSSGSQPLTTNTDSAKWDLIVDAASATTSASSASTSATAAANSATASANSATASANSATASATSETNAGNSATASANSATASASSATSAAASFDSFDDRYLGAKSSDPSTDNDGDALLTGALYFNSTDNVMKNYTGSAWETLKPTSSQQTNINTVAGISSNVTTVAGISSDVTAVAGISSDIQAVENIKANVTTVAGIASDVTSVAGISSAVSAVNSNASNINAVNSNASNINTVAGNNSNISTVAGVSSDVTTVAGISSNVTTVAGISANVTTVAGDTANIATIATNLSGSDTIGTVATNISNVNSVGGSISNVNTVASNLTDVNNFADRYRISAANPTTSLDAGDLAFVTNDSALKFYNGSSWTSIAPGISNVSDDSSPSLGGDLSTSGNDILFADNDKAKFGTGNDLEIYHTGTQSIISDAGSGNLNLEGDAKIVLRSSGGSENYAQFFKDGAVELYHNNSKKFETTSGGVDITGAFTATAASTITVSDNSTALELISTDADANVGPRLSLYRNSASPADNDILGDIRFMAEDDASAKLEFAKIEAKALDVSSGSRDTQLRFQIRHADSGNDILKLTPTEAVFNDGSFDTDFRVETNSEANAFVIDAGNELATFNVPINAVDGIDIAGDFIIDADGGDILFKDAGTEIGRFSNSSSNLIIKSAVSDKDIIIKGNDSGSEITALTFDMSAAGEASFGNNVRVDDNLKIMAGTGNDLQISHNGSNSIINAAGTGGLLLQNNTNNQIVSIQSDDSAGGLADYVKADGGNGNVLLYYYGSEKLKTISTGLEITGHVLPDANDTYDLGSTSKVWRNIYTGDLHLSNEAKSEGNAIDGTKGNWTIQEGAEDLYILNNKTGKKFKFKLEEIN